MAQFIYSHTGSMEITDLYHITGVVFPELENIKHGAFHTHFHKDQAAQVTFHNAKDGSSFTMPVSMSSLALLPSPQQRALEAQAAKDAQEIKSLKAKLSVAEHSEKQWKYHSDKQAAEIKRLETVCRSHWDARNDAERKWAETVGELDNTKNQLKEVRVANGKLLDTKHELEKHARGLETIVASQGRANTCQASKIQALESQLNLLKHQYEGKCRAVRDLQTTGSAKERDEYSKALDQLRAAMDTKVSQITKQAGEWKQTATTRAKEIDRLSALVLEITKERDALQAEKGLCPCKPRTQDLGDGVTATWMDYPLPVHQKPIAFDAAVTQAAKERLGALAQERLTGRVASLETRVTKLEEAEGFPIESYNVPDYKQAQLFMGGEWLKGVRGRQGTYYTEGMGKSLNWDKANQPTRWKPMPEKPNPDPMPGYYILDKSTQVEEGDEFEISPGVWMPSGNWSSCNKSQGKRHRYRRKIK